MENKFKYLEDTYLFEDESEVASIDSDEKGAFLTLEHTIFHPQGGGQPSDVGSLIKDGNEIGIKFVAFVAGEIRHYPATNDFSLAVGDKVFLKVDESARIRNSKAHTAGHLVQAVIENMPLNLYAVKGYHFLEGSYVEFSGPTPDNVEALIEDANSELQKIIKDGRGMQTKMVTYEELVSIAKHVPEGLPREKPLRVAIIDGFNNAVPCGGTHLRDIAELVGVTISKIKSKKGQVRVSYTVV